MRRALLAALVATLGLGACGDDPILPTNALTDGEVDLLAEALFARSFDLAVPAPASATEHPALRDVVEFSRTVEVSIPCEAGSIDATASISGTFDPETQAANVEYETTQRHRACRVTSDDGVRIVLDAAPGIVNAYAFELSGTGTIQFSGAITGGIAWTTAGDRSGTCDVALSFGGSASQGGSASATLTGTLCGVSVTRSVDVSG